MKKNEIWRSYGTDYTGMTKRLLQQTDLAGMIPAGARRIAIKPNLVTPSPASFGGTTHPEVVAGIIEYLQENGYRDIVIAEGSWVGDRTAEAFEYCGYRELEKKYDVTLADTQKEKSFEADCSGEDPPHLPMCPGLGLFDQCTCSEGTLPDAHHLRPKKHERSDPEHGKTPLPQNGAAPADCPPEQLYTAGFYRCGPYLRGSRF